jgi:hypothetical protein
MTVSFNPAGTSLPNRYVFNQGTIDFGTERVAAIDNISLSMEKSDIMLYVLGSIIGQDIAVHSVKATLSAKLKSFPGEIDSLAYGASTSGTPNENTVLDGQPTLQNPVVTLFDRNGKEIQYQLISAVFKSSKATMKSEDYAEFDIEIEALNIIELYTA